MCGVLQIRGLESFGTPFSNILLLFAAEICSKYTFLTELVCQMEQACLELYLIVPNFLARMHKGLIFFQMWLSDGPEHHQPGFS